LTFKNIFDQLIRDILVVSSTKIIEMLDEAKVHSISIIIVENGKSLFLNLTEEFFH